jgi:Uma2 family endonuclease
MTELLSKPPKSKPGEPVWALAQLYPAQGAWTERDYLALTAQNVLVEYTDGQIEVLPMPTVRHQRIVRFLLRVLEEFTTSHGWGEVLMAPLPTRLRPSLWREPDVVLFTADQLTADGRYPTGAHLVIEVVSPDDDSVERDYGQRRTLYAEAGIPEYWIVDPQQGHVVVLTLAGSLYREHGTFRRGESVSSALLPDLRILVSDALAGGPPAV